MTANDTISEPSFGSGDIRVRSQRFRDLTPLTIAFGVSLLSFAMSLWQLSVPQFISFYDTGVYLGAAMHLLSGVVPYRDFTFVQPPGILVLMSPAALISRLFGSHDGLIVARVIDSLFTAMNAGLLAWLLRQRGRVAMSVAGAALALLPVTFFVSSAVKLEPFCVFFVLVGAIVVFNHEQKGERASTRVLAVGGVLFGVAALVKLWAFFPFLALMLCLTPRYRRRVWVLALGASITFAVGCVPFVIASPGNFISQVIVQQLFRSGNGFDGVGIVQRLLFMSGFTGTSIAPSHVEIVAAFVILVVVVALAYWRRTDVPTADYFLLLAAIFSVIGLLGAAESYNYYGYFTAPFLLGVLVVSLTRVGPALRQLFDRLNLSAPFRRLATWALGVASTVLLFALVLYVTTFYTNYAWAWGLNAPYISTITTHVPKNSCVVYDYVIYGVYANRFQTSDANCPSVVDANGMWMKWGYQLGSPTPSSSFVHEWLEYFQHAQYVVLNNPDTSYVPWDAELHAWFSSHYRLRFHHAYVFIYHHDGAS